MEFELLVLNFYGECGPLLTADIGYWQGMLEVYTLGRIIQWNHIGFVWLTTLFYLMSFTRRWKSMLVLCHFWKFVSAFRSFVLWLASFVDYCCTMQRPHKAYPAELAQFHSADYVEFLHRITPDTQHLFPNELAKCTLQITEFLYFCLLNYFKKHQLFSIKVWSLITSETFRVWVDSFGRASRTTPLARFGSLESRNMGILLR